MQNPKLLDHSLKYIIREEVAKYDKLKKHYEDPTYEVVSGVFRALAKKKLIGAGNFQRSARILLSHPI